MITGFARSLRASLMDIESQFSLTDDPDGQLARARMAQAYGDDVTRLFFSLLEDTIEMTTDKPYNHPGPVNLSVRYLTTVP